MCCAILYPVLSHNMHIYIYISASDKLEEGGDDVKSSWPLRVGLHTCYNGIYNRKQNCEVKHSNLEEVKARGGTLYVFADPSVNMDVKAGKLVHMPSCDFFMTPIVYNIPLQILSYEVALLRGTDIDQPRNLAKSVTVE